VINLFLKTFLLIFSFFTLNETYDKNPPNIIFYLSDDKDQIDHDIYGNNLVPSNPINRLAVEGMTFENAYTTQSICAPSRSQIYTGLYPIKNGCYANHLPVKKNTVDVNDYLQSIGYEVVLAGKSHVNPNSVFNWTKYFKNEGKLLPMSKIKNYIKNAKKPYCLFIASDYPHGPFPIRTEFKESDIYDNPYSKKYRLNNEKGYYQNIVNDNNQLNEILDFIEINDKDENTLFIYASDGGLRGKWSVDEVGLKIPLIIRWPKIIKPGSKNSDLINLVDILPTIIESTGSKIPKSLDGYSFLSSLKGATNKRKYTYGISTRQNVRNAKIFPSRSIRDSKYKYIINYNSYDIYKKNLGLDSIKNAFIKIGAESFKTKPHEELYDLINDPYEMTNLINEKRLGNVLVKLKKELKSWMLIQNDFLVNNKMPLIKPTLHPLDKETEWTKVPDNLENKIKSSAYMYSHY
jgi:uncharacterized sulfatase